MTRRHREKLSERIARERKAAREDAIAEACRALKHDLDREHTADALWEWFQSGFVSRASGERGVSIRENPGTMSRETFVWDRETLEMVPAAQYHARKAKSAARTRSALSGPTLISDFSDPVLCMADGRRYGSKRFYNDALRAHGCEVVGNEKLTKPATKKYEPKGVGQDVKRAMETGR